MTEPPKAGLRAAFGFILVTVWLEILSLGVVIPVLAPLFQRFGGGDAAKAAALIGLSSTAWAVAQFFAAPILGALSDRFGRRPVLLISLAGLGIDSLLIAFAPTVAWLFVARIIAGFTAGGGAVANAYIADTVEPEKRAQVFGYVGAAWGAGFIIGPAIGGWLGDQSLRLPFFAAAAMALVAALYGLFVLPESLKPENRSTFSWAKANPVGSLSLLGSQRGLALLSVVNFLLELARNVLPTVFVLYTSNRYGWSLAMTGTALALTGACNIVVQTVLVKPIVGRIGEAGAMTAGLLFGGLGFAIYGLAPTGWSFLVGTPVFGLVGLYGPGFQGLITRRVAPNEQGRLQGANASLVSFACILGPLLFGYAYSAFNQPGHAQAPGGPFLLAALIVAAALALALPATTNFGKPADATA